MDEKKEAKILGNCNLCKEGQIKYYRRGMTGARFCDNCGVSTTKGDAVFTMNEAMLWK